jgi:hypothetical protein
MVGRCKVKCNIPLNNTDFDYIAKWNTIAIKLDNTQTSNILKNNPSTDCYFKNRWKWINKDKDICQFRVNNCPLLEFIKIFGLVRPAHFFVIIKEIVLVTAHHRKTNYLNPCYFIFIWRKYTWWQLWKTIKSCRPK